MCTKDSGAPSSCYKAVECHWNWPISCSGHPSWVFTTAACDRNKRNVSLIWQSGKGDCSKKKKSTAPLDLFHTNDESTKKQTLRRDTIQLLTLEFAYRQEQRIWKNRVSFSSSVNAAMIASYCYDETNEVLWASAQTSADCPEAFDRATQTESSLL